MRASGDVRLFDAPAASITATVDASGDVEVTATNQLRATLNASGNVSYKGQPAVSQSGSGSGRLIDTY